MRKVFMLIIAICSITFAAQAQKIGHISYTDIVQQMPQYKTAMTELETYAADYRKQIEALEAELKDKEAKFVNGKAKMTVAQQELAEGELNSLYTRYQEFTGTASNNVNKKRDELLKPVVDALANAIKDFAGKNGYDYILDVEQVHFAKDSNDITSQVKSQLGIK